MEHHLTICTALAALLTCAFVSPQPAHATIFGQPQPFWCLNGYTETTSIGTPTSITYAYAWLDGTSGVSTGATPTVTLTCAGQTSSAITATDTLGIGPNVVATHEWSHSVGWTTVITVTTNLNFPAGVSYVATLWADYRTDSGPCTVTDASSGSCFKACNKTTIHFGTYTTTSYAGTSVTHTP